MQSAAACVSKASPSTNWLSSVLLTMVEKSCLYSAPSEPPHLFRHLIFSFLHHTLSAPHAWSWYPALCIHRPPGREDLVLEAAAPATGGARGV